MDFLPRFLRPALLGALATLPLGAAPAAAHAILVASTPAANATVQAGATPILLRFNSRIDRGRSKIELRHGDETRALPIAPQGGPDQLQTQAPLEPGAYVLRWQVLAVDGHLTRGDIPFSVQAP